MSGTGQCAKVGSLIMVTHAGQADLPMEIGFAHSSSPAALSCEPLLLGRLH